MAQQSEIEWTDATWNPVTGCTKVGPGCDNCYAERFAERFRGVPEHPFEPGLRPSALAGAPEPARELEEAANDLRELDERPLPQGHRPNAFVDSVFDAMEVADWHIYQVLTKRSSLDAGLHHRGAIAVAKRRLISG